MTKAWVGQRSGLLQVPVLLTGTWMLVPALLLLTGTWAMMPALLADTWVLVPALTAGKKMLWMDSLELRVEMLAMLPWRWV